MCQNIKSKEGEVKAVNHSRYFCVYGEESVFFYCKKSPEKSPQTLRSYFVIFCLTHAGGGI